MKILVCTTEYFPYGSGIANVAYNVVNNLQSKGIECNICSPTGPDIVRGNKSLIKYGRIGLIYYWIQVHKYLRKNGHLYNIIWLHQPLFIFPFSSSNCFVTMHITSKSSNVVIQNSQVSYFYKIYYQLAVIIEKYCMNNLNLKDVKFSAVSKHVFEDLKKMGININNIKYIPNGVDIDKFKKYDPNNFRKNLSISDDKLIMLWVGRLDQPKRPKILLDIFAKLQTQLDNLVLIIAGNGPLIKNLEAYIIKNHLINVKLMGHVDHEKDLPQIYACSDLYILLSDYEGNPLTLSEALSSGLPCIVSNISSMDFVEEANCGIVVDHSDIDATVNKIMSYLNEKDRLSIHSKNARKYAVNNLSWKIIADDYLKDFKTVPQLRG